MVSDRISPFPYRKQVMQTSAAAMLAVALFGPGTVLADPVLDRVLGEHIQPGFTAFAESSAALAQAAQANCAPDDEALLTAFGEAWDAWINVSHLRFGPTETDNRAFALGFWPDKHNAVPKTLSALIEAEDGTVSDPAAFAEMSIAARGFTALEYLLFDETLSEPSEYHCTLIQAVTADIQQTAEAIAGDWNGDFGAAYAEAGSEGAAQTVVQAQSELLTANLGGIAFTKDARLARPMGSEEHPRPTRAEAYKSERSLRHVQLSIAANAALAELMAQDLEGADEMTQALSAASDSAAAIEDPTLASVADPEGRAAIATLMEQLVTAEHSVRDVVLVGLDLTEGFNALDGD